jgi:hypothetical protein
MEEEIIVLSNGIKITRKKFSKYTKDELSEVIKCSKNYQDVIHTLKINRFYHKYLKKFVENNNVDTSHFSKTSLQQNTIENLFIEQSKAISGTRIKKYLLKKNIVEHKCSICNMEPYWNSKPLSLQIDHINGNHYDNRIENLRLICPNCHSQTDTYTGRNLKKGETKYCSSCNRVIKQDNTTLKCATCISNDKKKCTLCLIEPRYANLSKCKSCKDKEPVKRTCKVCNKPLNRLTNKVECHKKCMKDYLDTVT